MLIPDDRGDPGQAGRRARRARLLQRFDGLRREPRHQQLDELRGYEKSRRKSQPTARAGRAAPHLSVELGHGDTASHVVGGGQPVQCGIAVRREIHGRNLLPQERATAASSIGTTRARCGPLDKLGNRNAAPNRRRSGACCHRPSLGNVAAHLPHHRFGIGRCTQRSSRPYCQREGAKRQVARIATTRYDAKRRTRLPDQCGGVRLHAVAPALNIQRLGHVTCPAHSMWARTGRT